MPTSPDLDIELDRLEQRLPERLARLLRWVRKPGSAWARYPLAVGLVAGGIFSFLPVLGLWMLPLGLVLIALDIPPLRSPMARLLAWLHAKWLSPRRPAKAKASKR
jgi:hypothetical protein